MHLAGRAHILKDDKKCALDLHRKANTELTRELAVAAKESNVKKFVYLSSIGVNGSSTAGKAFSAADPVNPHDAYSLSKYEAENELKQVAKNSNLQYLALRPPLVYGPGAKGNLRSLLNLCVSGIPLPFKNVSNHRSLIAVENLVEYIRLAILTDEANGRTLLVSDGEDISLSEIVSALSEGMKVSNNMFALPTIILKMLSKLPFIGAKLRKLTSDLQVDSAEARELLGWKQVVSPKSGLFNTGEWYRDSISS